MIRDVRESIYDYGGPSTPELLQCQLQNQFNVSGAREFLSLQGWPLGLQDLFIKNLHRIPIRFFLCDDSASVRYNEFDTLSLCLNFFFKMKDNDGHKVEIVKGEKRYV